MPNNQLSEEGRKAYIELIELLDKMPVEKLFYMIGYMQSEVDRNLLAQADERRG